MALHRASEHAVEVAKYIVGAGAIAVVGWFGAGQINSAKDVTGLQHDMTHEQEMTKTIAADIADIRHSLTDISRDLGTMAGQEQVQASDLSEVKRTLQSLSAKAPR